MRFVLPHDEPDRLTLVPVAAREEGVDEEYQVVGATAEAEAAAAAAAAPAVVKGGKVVVGGVVARAPTLRKKRVVAEVEGARGDGGEGEGSKKVKS